MTFKEKLVRLRKIKGLTQDEFASAIGVSRQAVYKWESGQSYPEVPKLLEIKMLFGESIDNLLDDNYEIAMPEKKKRKRLSKEKKSELQAEVENEVRNQILAEKAAETTATTDKFEKIVAPKTVENVPETNTKDVKPEEKTTNTVFEIDSIEKLSNGKRAPISGKISPVANAKPNATAREIALALEREKAENEARAKAEQERKLAEEKAKEELEKQQAEEAKKVAEKTEDNTAKANENANNSTAEKEENAKPENTVKEDKKPEFIIKTHDFDDNEERLREKEENEKKRGFFSKIFGRK